MVDENHNQFWADRVRQLKKNGATEEVISIAQKHIPYPGAFREIGIAIRKDIRTQRKQGKDSKQILRQLYRWAVIENFFCFIEWPRIISEPILHPTATSCIKGLNLSYNDIGYEHLGLLNKTDIKWLVESFGEPTKHCNAKDANFEQWKKAVAIFIDAKKRDEKYYWESHGYDGNPIDTLLNSKSSNDKERSSGCFNVIALFIGIIVFAIIIGGMI
jgi:hypothetical protein